MKLILNKNDIMQTPERFMQHVGYGLIRSRRTGVVSFVHRLSRNFYPRFHVYLKDLGDKFEVNLHLDQKAPSYQGQSAHSGEYDGDVVERELERIKQFVL